MPPLHPFMLATVLQRMYPDLAIVTLPWLVHATFLVIAGLLLNQILASWYDAAQPVRFRYRGMNPFITGLLN